MTTPDTPAKAEQIYTPPPASPAQPPTLRHEPSARRIETLAPGTRGSSPRRTYSNIINFHSTFILFVIIPSLVSICYLIFFASDQYVAETKFALRTAQLDSGKDSSSSSSTQGNGRANGSSSTSSLGLPAIAGQDSYIVAAYIRSPAIFRDLPPSLDVPGIFRRPEADFWARLPADASAERLTKYWGSMVSTYVESSSGVVTVSVSAFRRDDALRLAQEITSASERLVNQLSARARADAMTRAELEVRRSEGLVQAALADMRTFRDTEGVISPGSEASNTSTLLLNAMTDRIRLQSSLSTAEKVMSTDAPTLGPMRARLQAIDQQIEKLKSGLTGSRGDKVISASISRYEQLELQRQFAEKLYLMAQEALERAREKAERQSVYLSVFVPPYMPEEAEYPKRLAYSLLFPIGFLILWGIGAMLAATVQDHRV